MHYSSDSLFFRRTMCYNSLVVCFKNSIIFLQQNVKLIILGMHCGISGLTTITNNQQFVQHETYRVWKWHVVTFSRWYHLKLAQTQCKLTTTVTSSRLKTWYSFSSRLYAVRTHARWHVRLVRSCVHTTKNNTARNYTVTLYQLELELSSVVIIICFLYLW